MGNTKGLRGAQREDELDQEEGGSQAAIPPGLT